MVHWEFKMNIYRVQFIFTVMHWVIVWFLALKMCADHLKCVKSHLDDYDCCLLVASSVNIYFNYIFIFILLIFLLLLFLLLCVKGDSKIRMSLLYKSCFYLQTTINLSWVYQITYYLCWVITAIYIPFILYIIKNVALYCILNFSSLSSLLSVSSELKNNETLRTLDKKKKKKKQEITLHYIFISHGHFWTSQLH